MANSEPQHWLDLFYSEPFVRDFVNRLRHGREQNVDTIEGHGDNLAAVIQADAEVVRRAMRLSFEKHCLPRLPKPCPVTVDEVLEIAINQIAGAGLASDFEQTNREKEAYRRFVAHLEIAVSRECQGAMIEIGEWHRARSQEHRSLNCGIRSQ